MKRTPLIRGTALLARKPMKRSTKPMLRCRLAPGTSRLKGGKSTGKPTIEEQAWMSRITEFGCIVCYLFHGAKTPGAVHHLISGGRRMGHLYTVCLCDPGHHQGAEKGSGKISRHPDKARFEAAYGTEFELLEKTKELLGAGNA